MHPILFLKYGCDRCNHRVAHLCDRVSFRGHTCCQAAHKWLRNYQGMRDVAPPMCQTGLLASQATTSAQLDRGQLESSWPLRVRRLRLIGRLSHRA